MKPGPLYYHFAETGREEHEALVALVTGQATVEKIFLLGGTVLQRRTESLFTAASATATRTGHVYLLVLVPAGGEHTLACLQDKIEKAAEGRFPVTALLMGMARFNDWLDAGHPWAVCVRQRAVLLYDAGNVPFGPPGAVDAEALQREGKALFRQAGARITEFMAGADLFRRRTQYGMAAFMLHQATEQALRAMLIIRTGLQVNTHSLDRLLRYGAMFCHQLPDVFPQDNEREKALFSLLQRAYIEVRYGSAYAITAAELAALAKKTARLRELFESYGPVALGTPL